MFKAPRLLAIALLALAAISTGTAIAAISNIAPTSAGSYTLKWSAADPALNRGTWLPTYPHVAPTAITIPTGGRLSAPMANAVAYGPQYLASNFDAVTSLMPKDLVMGQIVPFELEIKVTSDTSAENGTISISPSWLAKTTSGGDFGFDPTYGIIAAFVDTGDVGTVDPGNNATVSSFSSSRVGAGTNNDRTVGDIKVTGLDNGDNIILEIWVVLKDSIAPGVTGNVQTNLVAAATGTDINGGSNIQIGNQTVPLLQVGDFLTKGADLSITKTDGPDPVIVNGEVTYTLVATNNSATTWANGVTVTDTLGAGLVYVAGSATVSGANTTVTPTFSSGILTVALGGLAPGQSATITYRATAGDVSPQTATAVSAANIPDRSNTARVAGIASEADLANNVATEYTGVIPGPSMRVTKTASPNTVALQGGDVEFTFQVTNTSTGRQPITVGGLVDSVYGDLTADAPLPVTLAAGESFTYRITRSVTLSSATDIHSNTATFTAQDAAGNELAGSATATVAASSHPEISLSKYGAFQDVDNDADASVGDRINYSFTVKNTGTTTLTNVLVTDPMLGTVSGDPISLAAGQEDSTTFYGSYTLTQNDIDYGTITNLAHVSGSDGTETVYDNAGCIVSLETPSALSIDKQGAWVDANDDGIPNAGEEILYTFTVRNLGETTLNAVTVTDPKVTVEGGPIASFGPGETDGTTFWGTYTLAQNDIDAGGVTNVAHVDGTRGLDKYSASDGNVVILPTVPRIELTKLSAWIDSDDDGHMNAGDTVRYSFMVKNTGNVTLADITITDPMVTVTGGPISSLVPGAEDADTFTADHVLTQADIDAGSITNIATVTGSHDGEDVEDTDENFFTVAHEPSISLVKSADVSTYTAGDTITYFYAITNTGNVTLGAPFTVNDDRLGAIVSLEPATLSPSETTTLTATHVATVREMFDGLITNDAIASVIHDGSPVLSEYDSVTLNAVANPAIELSKVGVLTDQNNNGPSAGDEIIYAFTVKNTGNVALTNVTITDSLVDTLIGGPIASLAVGATDSTTYSGRHTLTQADIDAGSVTNVAHVVGSYGEQLAYDDDAFTTTLDPTIELTIDKRGEWVDANGDGWANAGEVVNYYFTVTNVSEATVTDVTVTDPLVDVVGGPLASLAPGAADATTFYGAYTLTQVDIDRGSLTNVARVTGYGGGQEHWADDDDVRELLPLHRLELTKTGTWIDSNNDGIQSAGDSIAYVLAVRNTGNVTLTSITVTDALVAVSGGPIGSLAPGEEDTETFTALYTVTQADIDRGSVHNVATATGHFGGESTTGSDDDTQAVEQYPQLGLVKSADLTAYHAGDQITYTYVVTNTGNVTLLAPISVNDDKLGTITDGAPETLAPSESATLTATYEATTADVSATEIVNVAQARASFNAEKVLSNESELTLHAISQRSLGAFDKSALPAAGTVVLPGDVIAYTLSFASVPGASVEVVSLVDTLPASLDYVTGSMTVTRGGQTWAVSDAGDLDAGSFSASSGPRGVVTATFHGVGGSEVVKVTFKARVRPIADSAVGVHNVAVATGDGTPLDLPRDTEHPVDPVEFTKSGTDLNGGSLEPGDVIRWTIRVRNAGASETEDISVTDHIPTHTTYVAGSMTGPGANDAGAPGLWWTVGVLDAYQEVVLTFESTVDAGLPYGTIISNQANMNQAGHEQRVSDAPNTSTTGDPTLLQTGSNDWVWLLGALALISAGTGVMAVARRKFAYDSTIPRRYRD